MLQDEMFWQYACNHHITKWYLRPKKGQKPANVIRMFFQAKCASTILGLWLARLSSYTYDYSYLYIANVALFRTNFNTSKAEVKTLHALQQRIVARKSCQTGPAPSKWKDEKSNECGMRCLTKHLQVKISSTASVNLVAACVSKF